MHGGGAGQGDQPGRLPLGPPVTDCQQSGLRPLQPGRYGLARGHPAWPATDPRSGDRHHGNPGIRGIPTNLVSVEDFWHHSLYCGLLAQELGEVSSASRSESLFLAGLLHDIGQLVMFYKLPQHMHSALIRTLQVEDPLPMYRAEREVIGFDHAQVGEALAELWHLPSNLRECIAYHHEPGRAELFPVQVALVHMANMIASQPYIEESELDDWSHIDPRAWEIAGLSREQVLRAIEGACQQLQEARRAYFS